MAERRMLHRKAAVSSDLADLRRRHGGDAVAFFHQLIPFYDRWGCVPDDAQKLRAMACPVWDDVTSKVVKAWVEWLVKRGVLVRVSGPGGDHGLRNPAFMEHQRGTKFEREAPSPYEPKEITAQWAKASNRKGPNAGESGLGPDEVRTRSGPSPAKGRERKGSKPLLSPSLLSEESAPPPPEPSPVAQATAAEVEVNGDEPPLKENGRVDLEAFAADAPPLVAEAILRAKRRMAEEAAE